MTYDGSGDPAEDQVVRDLTAGIPGGLYGSISAGSYADDTTRGWEGYYQPGYDGPSPRESRWNRPQGRWDRKPPTRGGGNGGGSTGMTFSDFRDWQERQDRIEARNARQSAALAARKEGQSVYDWARSVFEPIFGPGLTSEVMQAVKGARSEGQALTEIRSTNAYKERFSGNVARQKAGLPMLSEAEYLGLENSYRSSMRMYGLPEGFYDDHKDFARYIENDVSPEELGNRAQIAGELAVRNNPQLWKELESRGLSKGDVAAYVLDPKRALPVIERKVARAEMGATARDTGMDFAKGNKFENKLVAKGITADAARAAMTNAADKSNDLNHIAGVMGEKGFSDKNLVKQELGIGGKRTRRQKERAKGLMSQERAEWAGGAGSGRGAFGGQDS